MTTGSESAVLRLLQPDLLTAEELADMLAARCPQMNDLGSTSKENLIKLFRRVILPLPQRTYPANRRGKLLTARRVKAGLEGVQRSAGSRSAGGEGAAKGAKTSENRPESTCRLNEIGSRLKPPPTSTSGTVRTFSSSSDSLDKIVINDRRRESGENGRKLETPKKISLKRSSQPTSSDTTSGSGGKKQRVAIKWP